MSSDSAGSKGVRHVAACVAIGAGIGWLTGLSDSPVVQTVIGAVIAVVGTVVAALMGLKSESGAKLPKIDPAPLVALIVGLAVAAPAGIVVREHRGLHRWLLGPEEPTRSAEPAVSAQPTMSAATPSPAPPGARPEASKPAVARFALHSSVTVEDCEEIRAAAPNGLRMAFRTANSLVLQEIGTKVEDAGTLESIRKLICQ